MLCFHLLLVFWCRFCGQHLQWFLCASNDQVANGVRSCRTSTIKLEPNHTNYVASNTKWYQCCSPSFEFEYREIGFWQLYLWLLNFVCDFLQCRSSIQGVFYTNVISQAFFERNIDPFLKLYFITECLTDIRYFVFQNNGDSQFWDSSYFDSIPNYPRVRRCIDVGVDSIFNAIIYTNRYVHRRKRFASHDTGKTRSG